MNIQPRKKIVLLGMMSKMPVPGNIWLVAQYLEGFRRLGLDAYYVEAHGMTPYALMRDEHDDGSARASEFIAGVMKRFELSDRWAFHARYEDRYFGLSEFQLKQLYNSADLIINLHGGTIPLPEHSATGRLVYLETDPVELQVELHNHQAGAAEFLAPHVAFFSWGLNYGKPDCQVPLDTRFPFRPTLPPVVLDYWHHPANGAGEVFTTVGNWRQGGKVTFRGEHYYWSKDREFRKVLDLPARVGPVFELALGGSSYTKDDLALLTRAGWRVREPLGLSSDLDAYREYIRQSRGEFTVAKDQNVRLRSGWFSERSATYLACGRPVVTQDTGFGSHLPTGAGLFAFSTIDDAAAAVEAIAADYAKHSRAASDIAREAFSYDVSLRRLLNECGVELPGAASSARARSRRLPAGVNVCGYLRAESGVGAASRSYVAALQSLQVPVALMDLSDLCDNRAEDRTLTAFVDDQPFDINLVCVDIDKHSSIVSKFGDGFFKGRYNVGLWWWEVEDFPAKWWNRFGYYDEIWAGTSFIANNLAPLSPLPVIRVPPVLTIESPGSRDRGRRLLAAEPNEFAFLFVFDFKSLTGRKNPEGVIQAFTRAFAPSEPVRLVIKSVNGSLNRQGCLALKRLAGSHPVTFLDGYWTAGEVRDLLAGCDAYVSLHRSEGLGFTIAEAMAHAKPVIATGWSGNMDFMAPFNSFPVNYELIPIEQNAASYTALGRWANPSLDHAAELMREVVRNQDEGRRRGEAARRTIEENYSVSAASAVVRSRLEAIGLRRRWPAFQRKAAGAFGAYRRLVQRVVAAAAVLPENSNVLVISRGDLNLLKVPARRTGHFPQLETGVYAGYYPADSKQAIAHLEDLRGAGADHLVIPRTAFWWLEHYDEFAEHLEQYDVIYKDASCVIYAMGATLPRDNVVQGVLHEAEQRD